MSITASEESAQAAVSQVDALISRWNAFDLDQRVIDTANKFLSPAQANEMIASVRAGLVELDMDNQLATLTTTLGKI